MRLERMWRRSRSSPVQVLATWSLRPFLGRILTRPSPLLSFRPLVFLGPSEGDPPRCDRCSSFNLGSKRGCSRSTSPWEAARLPFLARPRLAPPLVARCPFKRTDLERVPQRGGFESLGSEGPFDDERRFVNAPRTVREGHNAPSTSVRPPEVRRDRDEREAVGCTRSWTRAGVPSQAREWLGRRNGSAQGRVSEPGSGVQGCK